MANCKMWQLTMHYHALKAAPGDGMAKSNIFWDSQHLRQYLPDAPSAIKLS